MTNQEIIDAIYAEIKAASAVRAEMQSMAMRMSFDKYIDGLRFAKDLIEKAKEVTE